jgi:hypothetical protein
MVHNQLLTTIYFKFCSFFYHVCLFEAFVRQCLSTGWRCVACPYEEVEDNRKKKGAVLRDLVLEARRLSIEYR